MKRAALLAVALLLLTGGMAFAQDTTTVSKTDVSKWIVEEYVNSKGTKSNRYYCVYNQELVSTNKTTQEYVALTDKYGTRCELYLIVSKNGRKRMTLR